MSAATGAGSSATAGRVSGSATESRDEAMELPVHRGLTLNAYTAEPGSPSADALNLLASWAATQDEPADAPTGDRAQRS